MIDKEILNNNKVPNAVEEGRELEAFTAQISGKSLQINDSEPLEC